MELAGGRSTSYGASLQTLFPLASFGELWNFRPSVPAGFARFLAFGADAAWWGLDSPTRGCSLE